MPEREGVRGDSRKPPRSRDYRPFAAAIMALAGLLLAVLSPDGRFYAWRIVLGVPSYSQSFADIRAVTSGWDCLHRGLPFLPINVCDPWGRPPNLPRIWLLPGFLGLDQSSTDVIGSLIACTFVITALTYVGRRGWLETALVLLALVSPAAMLGIERGNADLVVFCLVTAGIVAIAHDAPDDRLARISGAAILCLASLLKFYPAFVLAAMVVRTRWAILALAAFGVYFVAVASDVAAINAHIAQPLFYAFGLIPFASGAKILPRPMTMLVIATGLVAITGAVAASPTMRRWCQTTASSSFEAGYLAASSIYVGSFLIAANFPYRLVYLILALPQAMAWARQEGSRFLGGVLLASILAIMWLPRFSWGRGLGSEAMAAVSGVLFVVLGSTALLILVRRLPTLRSELIRAFPPGVKPATPV